MKLSDADVVIVNAIRQDDTLYWGGFKEEASTIDQRGELLILHVCGGYRNIVGIRIDGTDGLLNMGVEHAAKFLRLAIDKAIKIAKGLESGEITVCHEDDAGEKCSMNIEPRQYFDALMERCRSCGLRDEESTSIIEAALQSEVDKRLRKAG